MTLVWLWTILLWIGAIYLIIFAVVALIFGFLIYFTRHPAHSIVELVGMPLGLGLMWPLLVYKVVSFWVTEVLFKKKTIGTADEKTIKYSTEIFKNSLLR